MCAIIAEFALYYSMWAGEKIEVEKSWYDIAKNKFRDKFFIGCDTKGFGKMDNELFINLFSDLFNYATITHYLPSFQKEKCIYIWKQR